MATLANKIKRLYGKIDYSKVLTFTAENSNAQIFIASNRVSSESLLPSDISLEYTTDDIIWKPYNLSVYQIINENGTNPTDNIIKEGDYIRLRKSGDFVRFRAVSTNQPWTNFNGLDPTYSDPVGYFMFSITGTVAASGNIMSLVSPKIPTSLEGYNGCFFELFKNCTGLRAYEDNPLVLGATDLSSGTGRQYKSMFEGCTEIEYIELPTEQINIGNTCSDGFARMFYGCTSLKKCNDLSFLVSQYIRRITFKEMFCGCTSLEIVPVFKFVSVDANETTPHVGDEAYNCMFKGCTSIVDASNFLTYPPNHDIYCSNKGIFEGCTSLEYAPSSLQNLLSHDYSDSNNRNLFNLFKDCTSLKQIVYDQNYWLNQLSLGANVVRTRNWVSGVPATGDFFCPATLPKIRSNHHIPFGWNVNIIDDTPLCFEAEETKMGGILIRQGNLGYVDIPIEYSTDGTTWQKVVISSAIPANNAGDKVYFRCAENSTEYDGTFDDTNLRHIEFASTNNKKFKVSGNLFTLLRKNGAKTTMVNYCFRTLFSNTGITTIPTLPDYGRYSNGAFYYTFSGVKNSFSAVNLKFRHAKFEGYSFVSAFSGSGIQEVTIDIPDNLLIATDLPIFRRMFYNCTSLRKIAVRFQQWGNPLRPSVNRCSEWVQGVPEGGTFVCPKTLEEIHDIDHIPVGWTVVHWIDEMKTQYPSLVQLCSEFPALEDVIDAHPSLAPIIDQYPDIIYSLIDTGGGIPTMFTRGDRWITDIYPNERMQMTVDYIVHSTDDEYCFGSIVDSYDGCFFIRKNAFIVGDAPYRTRETTTAGSHTASISTAAITLDGVELSGYGAARASFYTGTSQHHVKPIAINGDPIGDAVNDSEFQKITIREGTNYDTITHVLVPIADRVIADIADLEDVKIYVGSPIDGNRVEHRPSVLSFLTTQEEI